MSTSPLYTTEFSDIILVAGREKKEYPLHRVLLSTQSDFFKKACSTAAGANFKEHIEGRIELPTIPPRIMEVLLRWIYGGGLDIPDILLTGRGVICTTVILQTADYLLLKDFGYEIARNLMTDFFYVDSPRVEKRSQGPTQELIKPEEHRLELLNRCYNLGTRLSDKRLDNFMTALHSNRAYKRFFKAFEKRNDLNRTLLSDLLLALYRSTPASRPGDWGQDND